MRRTEEATRWFSEAEWDLESARIALGAELDRHYIPARYPNAMPSGSPHENYDQEASLRALQYAGRILDYARRQLA